MELSGYSVRIEGGKELGGYVRLAHCQQYALILRNNHSTRCDARVSIDGQDIGTWRIEPHSNIRLERPEDDTGRFTFYRKGTPEARQALIAEDDFMTGVVSVTFIPEYQCITLNNNPPRVVPDSRPWEPTWVYTDTSGCYNDVGGGTGLSGYSDQTYDHAFPDASSTVEINLRLIHRSDDDTPRPLTLRRNPVPPPVD